MRPQKEVEDRTRAIRLDFLRRYERDQLREQLYREQEGICAICKKLMQNSCSVVCVVDHAISVNMIANWDWNTELACEVANARRNLLATHVACNFAKREADYEEFMEQIQRGEIMLGIVPELTTDRIATLKSFYSERSRKAGRIAGRKNVESGEILRIRELPQSKEAYLRNGLNNVESGLLARIRELPQTKEAQSRSGSVLGRWNVESGHLARLNELPQTKEAQRRNGRKNAESGHLKRIANLPQTKEALRKRGHEMAENGYLKIIAPLGGLAGAQWVKEHPKEKSRFSKQAMHKRWHIKRGIAKPETCEFCKAAA